jgi:hypothetical protein
VGNIHGEVSELPWGKSLTYIYMYLYIYTLYVYTYIYIHTHTRAYMYIYICIYIYMCRPVIGSHWLAGRKEKVAPVDRTHHKRRGIGNGMSYKRQFVFRQSPDFVAPKTAGAQK